jgi:hypothetical protein
MLAQALYLLHQRLIDVVFAAKPVFQKIIDAPLPAPLVKQGYQFFFEIGVPHETCAETALKERARNLPRNTIVALQTTAERLPIGEDAIDIK